VYAFASTTYRPLLVHHIFVIPLLALFVREGEGGKLFNEAWKKEGRRDRCKKRNKTNVPIACVPSASGQCRARLSESVEAPETKWRGDGRGECMRLEKEDQYIENGT
jgi:hypothetical protein